MCINHSDFAITKPEVGLALLAIQGHFLGSVESRRGASYRYIIIQALFLEPVA